jgi:tRNA-specific 2-thiouridylase
VVFLKALSLFSGGLDSLLAIKLVQEAGIEVEAVHFILPIVDEDAEIKVRHEMQDLADQLGVKVHFIRLSEDYLRILENPKYGYGKGMNPCLDCHIFFITRAKELMNELNADFLVTGEVVGQRPKSQHLGAFPKIDRDTGMEGLIVRPLSARVLPKTIPEEKAWISLDHCPSIQGRQRIVQMDLARRYGLRFQPPGGGCPLTYKEFGNKVADMLQYNKPLPLYPMRLLGMGRHFRLPDGGKIILGRNQEENLKILHYFLRHRRKDHLAIFKDTQAPGPIGLGLNLANQKDLEVAARICTRYCDLPDQTETKVRFLFSPSDIVSVKIKATVDKSSGFEESYRI